jgi:ribokinase
MSNRPNPPNPPDSPMAIAVFGSLNMDLVTRTPRLPCPGETLTGTSFTTMSGGKGANQAVAVARLGGAVEMVGRVGDDAFGAALRQSLEAEGVGCAGVLVDRGISSGVAAIAIDDRGENHIVVVPGANGRVDLTDVKRLPQSQILMLQLEIPLPAVIAAAQAAQRSGAMVLLDPAPATDLPTELYAAVDIITPNQSEAERLTGITVQDSTSAAAAAEALRQRGVDKVIIKMGGQGAFCATADETFALSPFAVRAIDTVAAGDGFNGALAAALAEGLSWREACRWGMAAGAIVVTRVGAQTAMPTRAELLEMLGSQPEEQ